MIVYNVQVTANAARNEIQVINDTSLKVLVSAPPIGGKANKALISLLAAHFGVPKSRLVIISGETGKHKKVGLVYD